MTLALYYQESTDVWQPLSFTVDGISGLKLEIGYSHPAKLSWTMHRPQHTLPIPYFTAVMLVDTDYGNFAHAVFEGWVQDVAPAESNRLQYVAHDPTFRAASEITILSGSDSLPSVNPRLVYNCMIETDDDIAFERTHQATIGTMLGDILGDPLNQLRDRLAAPHPTLGGNPYVDADLDPLDFIPQEKQTFESEPLRSGIDRLLAHYPQYRMLFEPGMAADSGGRRWRFRNVTAAPQLTLTLNQFTSGQPHVLSIDLQRSTARRYSAVKIYGPRALAQGIATMSGDLPDGESSSSSVALCELAPAWTSGQLDLFLADPDDPAAANVWRVWQIDDPALRQLSHRLLTPVVVPWYPAYPNSVGTISRISWQPVLLATWDDGDTWEPVFNWYFLDAGAGQIALPYRLFKREAESSSSSEDAPMLFPDDVLLHFGYYSDPLWVRVPSTGYSGTIADVFGLEVEMRRYDESLAIGFERGIPYSPATRLEQFTKLAANLHEAYRDLVYTGGCTLAGIDYQFLRLNLRLNFAAVDADGEPLLTGWESINAILTSVEYDYDENLTTLQFSADHAEFANIDTSELKKQLKIDAVIARQQQATVISMTEQIYNSLGQLVDTKLLAETLVFPGGSLNEDRYRSTRSFEP